MRSHGWCCSLRMAELNFRLGFCSRVKCAASRRGFPLVSTLHLPGFALVVTVVVVDRHTLIRHGVCCAPPPSGLQFPWATGLRISGIQVEMEDFWAGALWALKIWLYLIVSLIMIPAMFGFSLGISETYMSILMKTLEVLLLLHVKLILWLLPLTHKGAEHQCFLSVLM